MVKILAILHNVSILMISQFFFNSDIVIDDDVIVLIMQNYRCKLQLDPGYHDFSKEEESRSVINSIILYATGSLIVLDKHALSIPFHFEDASIHTYDNTPIYSTGVLHIGLSNTLSFCEHYLIDDEFVIADELKLAISRKAETSFSQLFRVYSSDMLVSPEGWQEYANYFCSDLSKVLNRDGLTVLGIPEFTINLIGSTQDEDLFEDINPVDETDADNDYCSISPEEGKYTEFLRKSNYERALLEKSLNNPGITDMELTESMVMEDVRSVPVKALILILAKGSTDSIKETAISELYRRAIIVTPRDLEKIAELDGSIACQIVAYALNLQTLDILQAVLERSPDTVRTNLKKLYGDDLEKILTILEMNTQFS